MKSQEGAMFRRTRSIVGWIAVVAVLIFSAHYWYADRYIRDEWGVSTKADLSGSEMRMELSPTHAAEYTIRLSVDLKARNDQGFEGQHWVCKLASPNVLDENCKGFHFSPGHVDAAVAVRDGASLVLGRRNMPLNGYVMSSQGETQAVRELGRFVVAPGHHYTISARLRSDTPGLDKMNPTLRASISADYLEGEAYTDVVVGILTFLAIIGLTVLICLEFVIRQPSKPH